MRVSDYHKTEIWIEDVMSYFGEFLSREEAEKMLREGRKGGYFEVMNGIREVLVGRGCSVPFRAVYRRTKDEQREEV